MASIKIKFRPSLSADVEGTIYYQVIHGRKVRQLTSGYKIYHNEWDPCVSMVRSSTNTMRAAEICAIREQINCDVARLARIIDTFTGKGLSYTADDVIAVYERYAHEYSLFNYMRSMIATLKQRNQTRTSETYTTALNSIKKHLEDKDIMLDAITSETMHNYQSHLRANGNTPNTISFYMRILRAVYNNAVARGIIDDRHPFRGVFTGVEKTVKRALPLQIIKKIKHIDLSLCPKTDFARDMFLLSFYLRGMSFVDMAYLRKTDLNGCYISYRRRKTGQLLHIKWTDEMQAVLDKYPENPTQYLLPIITKTGVNQRRLARNVNERINRHLKRVAQLISIDIPLTMYCARHSWASAAKAKGIPVSVISQGLGHDSESTTKIYLADLDTSVVDNANALILNSL